MRYIINLPHFLALLLVFIPVTNMTYADETPRNLVEKTYAPYAAMLADFLEEKDLSGDGLVSAFDYRAALSAPDTGERLQQQRELLRYFDTEQLDNRDTAIAFWLNAYNFFMIEYILEHRPDGELIGSVWDYGGRINPFRDNIFERELFDVGGQKHSLDGMEKGILLGEQYRQHGWFDARVHFAVNCASVGCPPLRRQIYTPGNVDELMSENTRRAFSTPRHLRIDGDTLYLTRLFDWYEEHFVAAAGSVRGFIREYADKEVIEAIEVTSTIRHISYDWDLNKPANFEEFRNP